MGQRLLTVLAGSASSRDDVICGRAGQDELFGEEGNDYVLGGLGDDQLSGQNGSDRLKEGPDDEIATCRGSNRQPRQCAGGKRKDILATGGIEGGNQNDWMSGGQGDDDLFGDDGNDTLKTGDHVSANDEANGGPATDKCVIDAGDTANSCEQ
jgi:Ca2+-binding RTX toxin-like protein